jgi:hypothetical protein
LSASIDSILLIDSPRRTRTFLSPRLRIAVVRELLDVVHQAEQLPLRIDFLPAAQCEPALPLVVTQVAEHRLHRGKAPIAFAQTVVGDQRIDLARGKTFEIIFAVKTQFQRRLT